jgi:hypothetical protein
MEEIKICPLCLREIAMPANLHHLLPLSQGGAGTETVLLHLICHNKIHSLFTEKELAKSFNSIPKLLANEDIRKFINFVGKQPPGYFDRNQKAKRKNRF